MTIRECIYKNYGKCIELSNEVVNLIVTVEVGPRIIHYGFIGQKNEFCDDAQLKLEVNNDTWKLMGGHRLWSSPESFPRTYQPDNNEVNWIETNTGIKVITTTHPWVQTCKEIDISFDENSTAVTINHKIINKNAWPIEYGIWALTVLAPGGIQIIPLPTEKVHFSEGAKGLKHLILWSYADFNDPRLCFYNKYISLFQDSKIHNNFKMGILNKDGWSCYLNGNHMFLKKFPYSENGNYPDSGVSYETYTCDFMMEMESLSPLKLVEPEEYLTHTENWELIDNVNEKIENEDDIDNIVDKYIKGRSSSHTHS